MELQLLAPGYGVLAQAHHHRWNDPIFQAAKARINTREGWVRFQLAVRAAHADPAVRPIRRWIQNHRRKMREQLARMPVFPSDSGPLEQRLAQVRAFVELRRSAFRNKERTDRLLGLMALHFNHDDDVRGYARIIQHFLEQSHGNAALRHQVYGGPQLRMP